MIRHRDERGSMTGFVAIVAAIALVMVAGMAYDGGQVIKAHGAARNYAHQAARAGAQEIDLGHLRLTGEPRLDPSAAELGGTQLPETSRRLGPAVQRLGRVDHGDRHDGAADAHPPRFRSGHHSDRDGDSDRRGSTMRVRSAPRFVRGIASLGVGTVFLLGVPVFLTSAVGWPLPRTMPRLDAITQAALFGHQR